MEPVHKSSGYMRGHSRPSCLDCTRVKPLFCLLSSNTCQYVPLTTQDLHMLARWFTKSSKAALACCSWPRSCDWQACLCCGQCCFWHAWLQYLAWHLLHFFIAGRLQLVHGLGCSTSSSSTSKWQRFAFESIISPKTNQSPTRLKTSSLSFRLTWPPTSVNVWSRCGLWTQDCK